MKNKTLAALVLAGTTLVGTALNSNAQKREYLENSVSGTKYSNHKQDNKYKLEMQVLFGKDNPYNHESKKVYAFKVNDDWDETETGFTIIPNPIVGQKYDGTSELTGEEYIPTIITAENDAVITEFHINNHSLSMESRKNLKKLYEKKNPKKESQNKFGYSVKINDKNLKSILPMIKNEFGEFIYLNGEKGYFVHDGETRVLKKDNQRTSEIFIPLNEGYEIFANLSDGSLTIKSEEGFYNPIIKEAQQKPKKEETKDNSETPCTKNYVVKQGDTSWRIADKCYGGTEGKDLDKLENLNPQIQDLGKIKAGQNMNIPCDCGL